MIEEVLFYYIGLIVSLTIALAIYGVATRPHIVKKMALFTILGDAIYVLLVYLGYRLGSRMPPVYPGGTLENPVFPSSNNIRSFISLSVDPVPQVLIVTAIVIGLATFIMMAIIAIKIAEEKGTLNLRKIELGESE
ncbi:MAG: NADH-quinone oxidoreductase subunit K [Desulfurococcaceae archaeon TW002]